MKTNLLRVLLCFSALFSVTVHTGNPLGPCEGGRGVPIIPTSSGACGYATQVSGQQLANVNQAFYNNGAQCGSCYEVTGPLGTTTVMVADMCPSTAPKCGGDKVNFGINETAFFAIADQTTTDIIYDLGYRQVACDVSGNVQMNVGQDSNAYYFSAVFWNTRVGVSAVGVKASGWTSYQDLTRSSGSARWTWNQATGTLKFPITIAIASESNEVLSNQMASWTPGQTLDFGSQFANPSPSTGTCPMAEAPLYIFQDAVTYGWSTTYSFQYASIANDTSNPYDGADSLLANLYAWGGLQFTRDGGFDPAYFSSIQFAAKASQQASLRVYVGVLAQGQEGGVTLSNAISTQWNAFNISMADLQAGNVQYDIVFQNYQGNQISFWFDDIHFIESPYPPQSPNITYGNGTSPLLSTTISGSSAQPTGSVTTTGSSPSPSTTSSTGFDFDHPSTTSDPSTTGGADSGAPSTTMRGVLAIIVSILAASAIML